MLIPSLYDIMRESSRDGALEDLEQNYCHQEVVDGHKPILYPCVHRRRASSSCTERGRRDRTSTCSYTKHESNAFCQSVPQESFRQLYREGALEDNKITIEVPPSSPGNMLGDAGQGAQVGCASLRVLLKRCQGALCLLAARGGRAAGAGCCTLGIQSGQDPWQQAPPPLSGQAVWGIGGRGSSKSLLRKHCMCSRS